MAGNTATPGASVAARVLSILGSFDADHRSLTLSEVARRAGLPVPTAHRMLGELVAWGALARGPSGAYVVGRRMWDLGLLAPVQSGLRQVASPFLHDIYAATLATVHLAVRDDLEVLYIDRLSGHASVPVVSQVGSRLPMHATGVGKVLLAFAPEPVQGAVLAHLTRCTRVHHHPAGPAAQPAAPRAPRRLRPDQPGDEPGRLLGGRPDPYAGRPGRRRARSRGPHPSPGPGPAGRRAPGRRSGDRSQPARLSFH